MNLCVYVNEDRAEKPNISKSGTVVVLRQPTRSVHQIQLSALNVQGTEASRDLHRASPETPETCVDLTADDGKHPSEKETSIRLEPNQDQQEQAPTGTSMPDTQERMQLAAIASMVRSHLSQTFHAPHVICRPNCVQTAKAFTIHKSLTGLK